MDNAFREKAIEYIKNNIDLIDNNYFEDFYSKMNGDLNLISRSSVTSLLLESGINPLIYMSRVPEYYLYEQGDINPFMKSIIIPNSVKNIGVQAFDGCKSLNEVSIPPSVEKIGSRAFSNCSSLESVVIPSSVKTIDSNTFYWCTSLKNVILKNGISIINWGTFRNCRSLTYIIIPNSVTNIEGVAFANCKSLTNIYIPESVAVIGNWAFKDCTSLETINYKGNKTQWGEVYKRSGWNKGVPAKVIHCTDGDVELSKSKS